MAKFLTPLKLSENIRKTPEGYLLCLNVPIARTGWQEYGPGETPLNTGDDGRTWIHREAEDVFTPKTIASFMGKSVTIRHPDDFVDPKNWKTLTVGIVQNVRKADEVDEDGEEMLIADLLITDENAIGLVLNGLREVSCGYDAEYEETANGEGRQFNIVGNHIALVEAGRAGATYAIKDHKGKAEQMGKLKELFDQVKKLTQTVDSMEQEKADKLAKAKKKTADEEGASYDELMKAVKDLSDKVEAMGKPAAKDEEKEEKKPEEEKSEDEDKEEEKSEDEGKEEEEKSEDEGEEADGDADKEILSRVKALEAAVAKILKSMGSEDEDSEEAEDDEEMSGSEDEEAEEGEESQKKEKKTGDAAKFEILTPGKKYTGKDARAQCLKEFAKTEDGKAIMKKLGVAKPVFDAKTNVDMLFVAASALVKAKRGTGLERSKDGKGFETGDNTAEAMTPEKMNELMAKHYSGQKQ